MKSPNSDGHNVPPKYYFAKIIALFGTASTLIARTGVAVHTANINAKLERLPERSMKI